MTCSMRSGLIMRVAVDAGCVLGGDEHGAQAHRLAVLVVEGDLGLAVGAQVRDDAGPAHLGQPLGQAVRQPDRQRHEVVGLVAGVAEHHPLVAGALGVEHVLAATCPVRTSSDCVDALGDVGRLLVDRDHDAAGVAVEADTTRGRSRCRRSSRGRCGGCRRRPSVVISPATTHRPVVSSVSHATRPVRVLGEDGVEDGVGDLVGHLVGMALGDRLRGEGPAAHCVLLFGDRRSGASDDGVEDGAGDGPLVGQRDICRRPSARRR